jgi:2,4-dienoyl-CoA reductase-like NADH-dependent reductase (Old Yellow Enzyme family)
MPAARLFEPVRLGPALLRNRTVRAAAFEGMCPQNSPSPELTAYHRAVAAGGVGMTTIAYAAVEQSGLSFSHQLWLRPEVVSGLRALTGAVHAEGAKASIQIGHCGNMAKASVAGGRPIAPSARFNLYGPTWPRAMARSDIARVTESFGRAVDLARDAGFDAVEVHAGHGYLISQFRMRLLREVIARVVAAARDDVAVIVKMNLRDGFPGGMELDESILVARALEQEGAHALVLSGGFVSRAPMYVMRGAMPTRVMAHLMESALLRAGVALFGQRLIRPFPYEENYFLEDATRVRAEVKMPLIYVGGAASRAAVDRVLARGFDAVAMARALIRDPSFVARLAEEEARSRAASGAAAGSATVATTSPQPASAVTAAGVVAAGTAPPPACDHCNYCAARIYTGAMACHRVEPPSPEVARLLHLDGVR